MGRGLNLAIKMFASVSNKTLLRLPVCSRVLPPLQR